MFYTIIFLVIGFIIWGLIYLATLDAGYAVRRTKLINTSIGTVFDKIRDFKTWADWSPWLMHEPNTKLVFSDNCSDEGGYYTWDGKLVGAGKLMHVKFDRPHRIEQGIGFTRPFKAICQVTFEFSEKNGQTEVAWIMLGKMPFLFRFMAKKTANMISKDYELGLSMLAGQLDPNAEHPSFQFVGETTLEPVYSLCKGFEGGLQEMEAAMKTEFPKLKTYIENNHGHITGKPFSLYHKVDTKNMDFVCDMAVPVREGIDAGEYQLKTLGGGKFYKINLKGSYQFLELAWYAAMVHLRMRKLKYDTLRPSLEVYENDPNEVSTSNEIQTTIYVAIK